MELGSEFNISLQNLTLKKFNVFNYLSDYQSVYFDSGRSALKHISASIDQDSNILLPEFICDSVIEQFRNRSISFYRLNHNFTVDVEYLRKIIHKKQKQIIFLMHYFGKIQPKEILQAIKTLAEQYECLIIEDTTHSIFSNRSTVGNYQICSIRKWLPIPKGGILYSKDDKLGIFDEKYVQATDNDRVYAMILKELFLNHGVDSHEIYRKMFLECEERLNQQKSIQLLSDFAKFMASCVDISVLINTRQRNYTYLCSKLKSLIPSIGFSISSNECPFVFPLRVPERDKLRAYLIEHKIYCAVHWPFDGFQEEIRSFAKLCANEIISLPIDQRYGYEHMDYMLDILSQYGGVLSFYQ